jgi:hypothetical protein
VAHSLLKSGTKEKALREAVEPKNRAPLILMTFLLLCTSGCFVGVFNNPDTQAQQSTTTTEPDATCIPNPSVPGQADACFGNSDSTPGNYRLALDSTNYAPMRTDITSTTAAVPTSLVSATASDGTQYMAYPILADGLVKTTIVELKKSQTGPTSTDPGLVLAPFVNEGRSAAVTDLEIEEGPSSNIRYLYYAGTQYNTMTTEHEFFVCRVSIDSGGSSGFDPTFYNGGPCASFDQNDLDLLVSGTAGVPIAAFKSPVHLAFHVGADGTRRVVLAGMALDVMVTKAVFIPICTDGSGICGAGSLGQVTAMDLRTDDDDAIVTSFESNSGTLSKRKFYIAALETNQDETAPSALYVLLSFFNEQVMTSTFDTDPSNKVAEHFLFRLNSSLDHDNAFGAPYTFRGIYLPQANQSWALHTRPWSTSSNSARMKVGASIYILGTHSLTGNTSEPGFAAYKLIKYSTSAASDMPSGYHSTSQNTMCSLKASPSLVLKSADEGLIVACAQSTVANTLIREHTSALTVDTRQGNPGGNYAAFIENSFTSLSGTFGPGLSLFRDDSAGTNSLYTVWLERSGTSYYPAVRKSWQ